MKKILITGGHITPALAVIEALDKQEWKICFVGRQYASETFKIRSIERELIEDLRIKFIDFNAGRISKRLSFSSILSFLKIPLGFIRAFSILLSQKPDVVLSFGGYLSSPIVFASWILRIPSLTHEQTASIGLATKFNGLFSKRILLSWENTINKVNQKKSVLVGNPARRDVLNFDLKTWKGLSFNEDLPLVFITGGNQGSHIINKTVEKALPRLVKNYNVFHLVGHLQARGDYKKLKIAKKQLSKKYKARFRVEKYLNTKQMGALLNKADLVVSRSGANTITELALLGKPSLLIPLPDTHSDEQVKNAKLLAKAGISLILPQNELSSKVLCEKINQMIEDASVFKENASKALRLVDKNAASNITSEIESVLK
ncbi:MAG: UDP-N-acetylglucosamine--N-acetylmuramyl-(pentapeptide) pyrophosphoryl-undecaprenol N-acetylglucosamine transferase [Patescibacteria group bacterium]